MTWSLINNSFPLTLFSTDWPQQQKRVQEEIVTFALLVFRYPIRKEKKWQEMAETLLLIPSPADFHTGKPRFPVDRIGFQQNLRTFIGERSWILFEKLNGHGDWLHLPVAEWETDQEYVKMKAVLKDLKVINDPAERCIKDIQDYFDLTTDSIY